VTFALPRDTPGGAVSVVGDFNDWDDAAPRTDADGGYVTV